MEVGYPHGPSAPPIAREAKHGTKSRRTWRKLHLAVDAANGMIVARTLTDRDADDPYQLDPVLDQIGDPIIQFDGQ
jgi:hypothetical protein